MERAIRLGVSQPDRPVAFGLQPVLAANLTLTDDERIQRLNREYRGIDAPTDVLSFSQVEGGGEFVFAPSGRLEMGDVTVSVETARRQAAQWGHSLEYELCLLAAHGGLHLLGYDHVTEADAGRMNGLTREVLEGLGFGDIRDERLFG